MGTEHTPGNWIIYKAPEGATEIRASKRIADLWIHGDTNANARLIAAAPDGLLAAQEAYLLLLQIPHDTGLRISAQSALYNLRNFIAKATGREEEDVQDEFEAKAREEA